MPQLSMFIKHSRFTKKLLIVVALCWLAIPCLFHPSINHAQNQAPAGADPSLNLNQWGAVTLFHGLPSNHARTIAQSADGVLWFGTDAGLAKYDGRRILKITDAGLPAGRIRVLRSADDGPLWIGTDSGATRLINGQFYPVKETLGHPITDIVFDHRPSRNNQAGNRGRAIISSELGEIFTCSIDPNNSLPVQVIGPAKSPLLRLEAGGGPLPITSLTVNNSGILLGTHGRGLLTLNGSELKEVLSRPRPFFVSALSSDADGRLLIGAETSADSGLYAGVDLRHPEKLGSGIGAVTAIATTGAGDVWAGTAGRGVFHFLGSREIERFTFENTAGGLRSDLVYTVFADREGLLWFGTDRGICRYDPHSFRNEKISDYPESNFIRALFESADGYQWCGTNRGLFYREPTRSAWAPATELAGRTIHSIAADSAGRLLVGTAGGLYAEERGTVRPTPGPLVRIERGEAGRGESVRAICQFQGVTYLATFGQGLERLDGDNLTLIWPLESAGEVDSHWREVTSLHVGEAGRLWIGTTRAGAFYLEDGQVRTDPSLAAMANTSIWSIAGSGSDGLWFGTGQGVYHYLAGQLTHLLNGTDIRSVISDGPGAAWCASVGAGLHRVIIDPTNGPIVTRLDTEQGLPSDSVFTILNTTAPTKTEMLWLGTNRGLASFQPGRVAPTIQITRVLGERAYSAEELMSGLRLGYPQNSLLVDFAAISSRTFPEQFQYSYDLVDDKQRPISHKVSRDPQLSLEHLKPGRYRVSVLAYTSSLVRSEPLVFQFDVARAPFPWVSTGLGCLLALALAALWWGYNQNQRLAGANRQLAETRMQLANETENERRRIARDLHDQTLSDLRRLMLRADQIGPAEKGTGSVVPAPAFRADIEAISTEIRHICEDLSPSVLANVGLTAALEFALSDAIAHIPPEDRPKYEFNTSGGDSDNPQHTVIEATSLAGSNGVPGRTLVDLEEQLAFPSNVEIQIYRIVQEAISNVIRHARAHNIWLTVRLHDDLFLVRLEDDGVGFDADHVSVRTSRGLSNIRSRASLIDAEVVWSARDGGGTIFTLGKQVSA